MDLKVNAYTGAAHLIGIALLLRKIYLPHFQLSEPLKVALQSLEAREIPRVR